MKPEEKAEEILRMFIGIGRTPMVMNNAKECSLIACNIAYECCPLGDSDDYKGAPIEAWEHYPNFWIQVKQEIIKQ